MPIYEYECEKCGHQTEVLQKFSDPAIAECDACHGKMKKLISNSTFHLKGSGWYVTDYASKSGSSGARSRAGETNDGPSDTAKAPKVEAKGSADSSPKTGSKKVGD
jgi:putative FmdB family regulatory protein